MLEDAEPPSRGVPWCDAQTPRQDSWSRDTALYRRDIVPPRARIPRRSASPPAAAGLLLARISEETGLSPDHLRAIEQGREPLPLQTFIIITEMADVLLDIAATQALTHLNRLYSPPETCGEEGRE